MAYLLSSARFVVFALCTGALPSPVAAQEPARRPFRVVFGGAPERAADRQHMRVTTTFVQAWDDNVLADQLTAGDPRFRRGGTFPTGSIAADYDRPLGRGSLTAATGTSVQYYPQLDGRLDRDHHARLGAEWPIGSRTRVTIGQAASFATFYTLDGLPGGSVPEPGETDLAGPLLQPRAELGVSTSGGWQYHTSAALARQVGRRGSMEGHYGFVRTDLASLRTHQHEAGGGYALSLTRQLGLVTRYTRSRSRSDEGVGSLVLHDVDLGINYGRRLTRSGNTSVSFSTGSAVVVRDGTERDYRLLVDTALVHLMGRSWTATAGYNRGVEFVAVLGDVVTSQAVTAALSGYVNPRLQTTLAGTYSRGFFGSRHGAALNSYSTVAGVQYALSSRLALDARHLYYVYEFGDPSALPVAAPIASGLTRQTVRVGLTLLLDVLR